MTSARLLAALCLLSAVGCAPLRSASVALDEARDGPVVVPAPFGEVSCGHGQVCAEIEVARVQVRRGLAGEFVEVTLRNRTGEPVVVQLALETFDAEGASADRTGFVQVALPARQSHVVVVEDVRAARERLVVHLRART